MRNAITVREAQNLLKQHDMVMTFTDGEYRVNYRHGSESTAYYTNDIEDAIITGIKQAEWRIAKEIGRRNKVAEHRVQS